MGRLTDKIRNLIDSLQISSASPGHINEVLQFDPSIELDEELKESISENKLDGNLGEVQSFTKEQMGNVSAMATNPAQFIIGRVFGKFTKGAGVAALALIFFEVVKTILDQLYAPGRALDLRFRETINRQIVLFLERKEQQELRQGFSQVITTTMFGLRGDRITGQVGGNFYNPERIPANFLDSRRVSDENPIPKNAMIKAHQGYTKNRYSKGPGG